MRNLDVFLPKINLFAPGVGIPTAYSAIRDAAIALCTRTGLWRWEDDFTFTFPDGEDITVPYGAQLLRIEHARFNDCDLTPKTVEWLDEHEPKWRTGEVEGNPRYLCQIEPGTLRVVPFATGTVKLAVKLQPAQDCQQLPDFMADLYREVIAWGALGDLLLMPNQPYTNPGMAAIFQRRFADKLDSLASAGSRGQQGARTRSRPNYF